MAEQKWKSRLSAVLSFLFCYSPMLAQQTKGIDKGAPMIVIGTGVPKEFWKVLGMAQLHDDAELAPRRNGAPLFQEAAQVSGRPVGWLSLTISGLKPSDLFTTLHPPDACEID